MNIAAVSPVITTSFLSDETESRVIPPTALFSQTAIDNFGFHVDK